MSPNFLDELEKDLDLTEVHGEIAMMRDRIKDLSQYEDPNQILQRNIERAEALLDRVEAEIDNGISGKGGLARLLEVASGLLNVVTTAANSMMSMTFDAQGMELKEKTLTLKEYEVKTKLAQSADSKSLPAGQTTNNTVNILTSREEILDLLRGQQKQPAYEILSEE